MNFEPEPSTKPHGSILGAFTESRTQDLKVASGASTIETNKQWYLKFSKHLTFIELLLAIELKFLKMMFFKLSVMNEEIRMIQMDLKFYNHAGYI